MVLSILVLRLPLQHSRSSVLRLGYIGSGVVLGFRYMVSIGLSSKQRHDWSLTLHDTLLVSVVVVVIVVGIEVVLRLSYWSYS